jgi:hypothetical protein
MHAQDGYRWLRWFLLDHALLLVLILMIATILSVLFYRADGDFTRSDSHLQRSVDDRL